MMRILVALSASIALAVAASSDQPLAPGTALTDSNANKANTAGTQKKVNFEVLGKIHEDAGKALAGDSAALEKLQNTDCNAQAYVEGQQQCCKRTSDGCACLSDANGACRPKCDDFLPAQSCSIEETVGTGGRSRRAPHFTNWGVSECKAAVDSLKGCGTADACKAAIKEAFSGADTAGNERVPFKAQGVVASVEEQQCKVNFAVLGKIHEDAGKALAGDSAALEKLQNTDCNAQAYVEGQQQCCKRTSDGCACLSDANGACRPKCDDFLPAQSCSIEETVGTGGRSRRAPHFTNWGVSKCKAAVDSLKGCGTADACKAAITEAFSGTDASGIERVPFKAQGVVSGVQGQRCKGDVKDTLPPVITAVSGAQVASMKPQAVLDNIDAIKRRCDRAMAGGADSYVEDQQRCCKRTSTGCACLSAADGTCRPKCADHLPEEATGGAAETASVGGDRRLTRRDDTAKPEHPCSALKKSLAFVDVGVCGGAGADGDGRARRAPADDETAATTRQTKAFEVGTKMADATTLANLGIFMEEALKGDRSALDSLKAIDCNVNSYEEGQQRCCKRKSDGCECMSEADGSCQPKCADVLGFSGTAEAVSDGDRMRRDEPTARPALVEPFKNDVARCKAAVESIGACGDDRLSCATSIATAYVEAGFPVRARGDAASADPPARKEGFDGVCSIKDAIETDTLIARAMDLAVAFDDFDDTTTALVRNLADAIASKAPEALAAAEPLLEAIAVWFQANAGSLDTTNPASVVASVLADQTVVGLLTEHGVDTVAASTAALQVAEDFAEGEGEGDSATRSTRISALLIAIVLVAFAYM